MAQQETMSLRRFKDEFPDEDACCKHMFQIRWPEGYRCPKCGHAKFYYIATRKLYECKACRHQTSVTAGTVMHKSHTKLDVWFLAIYLIAHDKRGISGKKLEQDLEVSYPTAWLMLHKIRKAMGDRDAHYMLAGIVELDDAFFGGPTEGGKRGRGTDKTKAVIGLSVDKQGRPKYIKATMIENLKANTLAETVKGMIQQNSVISSDLHRSYPCLEKEGYTVYCQQFNPKESPDHLKWLHTVISNLKALIVGTYHGLDSKHLQAYFNEYCYRFNRRKFKGQLFNRLLNACLGTTTITYRHLVDGVPVLT
jgi:transposase-like protein